MFQKDSYLCHPEVDQTQIPLTMFRGSFPLFGYHCIKDGGRTRSLLLFQSCQASVLVSGTEGREKFEGDEWRLRKRKGGSDGVGQGA